MTRVFFDIDGVLARYKETELSALYQKGYFKYLEPCAEAITAIKELAKDPDLEVHILSAYLGDSEYALEEKKYWVNKYLGNSAVKPIFLPCGENKSDAVPGGIKPTDILIDDYNVNLRDWEKYGVAIKFLNGINHKHGSWKGLKVGENAADIKTTVYNAALGIAV